MNLSRYKVIDSHCHLLLPEKETKQFEEYWSLSRLQIESKHLKNLMNYRLVVQELGRLLLGNPDEGPKCLERCIKHFTRAQKVAEKTIQELEAMKKS